MLEVALEKLEVIELDVVELDVVEPEDNMGGERKTRNTQSYFSRRGIR